MSEWKKAGTRAFIHTSIYGLFELKIGKQVSLKKDKIYKTTNNPCPPLTGDNSIMAHLDLSELIDFFQADKFTRIWEIEILDNYKLYDDYGDQPPYDRDGSTHYTYTTDFKVLREIPKTEWLEYGWVGDPDKITQIPEPVLIKQKQITFNYEGNSQKINIEADINEPPKMADRILQYLYKDNWLYMDTSPVIKLAKKKYSFKINNDKCIFTVNK